MSSFLKILTLQATNLHHCCFLYRKLGGDSASHEFDYLVLQKVEYLAVFEC